VETFNTYILDVIHHVVRMKREYSDIPCFLMGHSMVSAGQYTSGGLKDVIYVKVEK